MKMFAVVLGVLLISLTALAASAEPKDEIIFAAVVVRHGARHMLSSKYMNITNNAEFLRNPGRLTNVGKRQLYLLGRQLADMYMVQSQLLGTRLNPYQICVRSSGTNRTIESVQSLLSGLFQPGLGLSLSNQEIPNVSPPIAVKDIQKIRQELRDAALPYYMSPIPVHTTPGIADYLFSPHTECTTAIKADEKQYTKEFSKLSDKYSDFYKNLAKYNLSVANIEDVYMLYDNILAARGNAVDINIKLTPEDNEMLHTVSYEENMKHFPRSEVKVKLLTHVILSDVRKHFIRAVEDDVKKVPKEKSLRMAILQISDCHILALSKLLPIKLLDNIPFAASVIFELHKQTDTYGNVFYRVKSMYNGKPFDLTEQGLDKFEAFRDYLGQHVYSGDAEFKEVCYGSPADTFDRETYMAITVILLMSFVFLWGANWFLLTRKTEKKSEEEVYTDSMLRSDLKINTDSHVTINETVKSEPSKDS